MLFTTTALCIVGLNALAVDLAPDGLDTRIELPEHYTLGVMTWTGPVTPGGINEMFEGTAQSILRQIQAKNPDYPLVHDRRSTIIDATLVVDSVSGFEKRWMTDLLCNKGAVGKTPSPRADLSGAVRQLEYLRSLGRSQCRVDPRSCVRVSCSYNDAIW
ncbi:hypothetical protein BCR34DRAFT_596240 [Clohesyomyces aquaticus]|uniref:Uncharacterized protein n=1 Tax=Clohesyomyces aquaticus TaxID=1231657 RepID=A0A1Y2A7L1_9PLEO|nr:hypothetical protein BCR34DRAFT_596240 [Clohesyomyces aquaticus]